MLDPMIQILETLHMVTVGMRHKATKEISKPATILSMTFRIKQRSSMERLWRHQSQQPTNKHESLKVQQWEVQMNKKSWNYDRWTYM